MRPRQAQQVTQAQAGMRSKIDRVSNIWRARFLQQGDVRVCPNDFRSVATVELLDALTWIARNAAERINSIREHAGEHLHAVVRCSRLGGPLIPRTTDNGPDLFRSFELRNPKIPEICADTIEPRCPLLPSRFRELGI